MKILVNVYIPAIGEQYDVLIPDDMRSKYVTDLIANTMADSSGHLYVVSGNEKLCSVEKNILLRPNATLKQYGIKNGDHLVMI